MLQRIYMFFATSWLARWQFGPLDQWHEYGRGQMRRLENGRFVYRPMTAEEAAEHETSTAW